MRPVTFGFPVHEHLQNNLSQAHNPGEITPKPMTVLTRWLRLPDMPIKEYFHAQSHVHACPFNWSPDGMLMEWIWGPGEVRCNRMTLQLKTMVHYHILEITNGRNDVLQPNRWLPDSMTWVSLIMQDYQSGDGMNEQNQSGEMSYDLKMMIWTSMIRGWVYTSAHP